MFPLSSIYVTSLIPLLRPVIPVLASSRISYPSNRLRKPSSFDCVPVSSPGTVHPGVFTDVPSASSTAQHWTQEFRVERMDRTVRILKETKIIQRGLGNKNNQRNTSANEKSVQDQRGRCLHFFCFLVCLFSNFLKLF